VNFRYDPSEEKLVVSSSNRIEYHQIKIWLTRHVKGYRFLPAVKMGVWNGQQSYFDNGKINLGLWRECLKACKEINVPFIIDNKEEFPLNREVTLESVNDFCKEFFKSHKIFNKDKGEWIPFMPYDYQIETAFKILKNRYCMAEVATSGGKTLIVSIVYFYTLKNIDNKAKLLLVVPSITLVTQFYDSIVDFNIGMNKNYDGGNPNPLDLRIEEIMSDRPRKHGGSENPNIYIGTYQSLEKWPKTFFEQFHTVAVDEGHLAKAATLTSILKRTFGYAYNRFGVSGTFPPDDSLEILTIQSVLGPNVTKIEASTLVKSGTITPMAIKAVILNHADSDISEKLNYIKKMGAGSDAFRLEKEIIQSSDKRIEFIKKLVDKCNSNTLLLFHTIEYGTKIFNKLKEELQNKDIYYIDGEVNNKKREEIKKQMEVTKVKLEYTILNFGDYEIEFESDFKILLSNGKYKLAKDIDSNDDIDDEFLKKIRK
jgi:superfamily II DNA or RNA helicase